MGAGIEKGLERGRISKGDGKSKDKDTFRGLRIDRKDK